MQLTVRIRPYFKDGLKGTYPALAQELSRLDAFREAEDFSLFDIVQRLDQTPYELEQNPPFREILLKHRRELLNLHEKIETHIADWQLAQADKMLYQVEDIFDDIERELGKI